MSMRTIRSSRLIGANLVEVELEVTNAYTDGTSRRDRVVVAVADGATDDDILEAIVREDAKLRTLAKIAGREIPSTGTTSELILERPFAVWDRWKAIRTEAEARAAPAPLVAALTQREDRAWAALLAAIQTWRDRGGV
jgi:hypothetical protein